MDLEPIIGGLTALIVFVGLSTPVIVVGVIYYLKKRLEHRQIMLAIEKGTPLSELRPAEPIGPLWIKNLTAGIAMLIIAAGLTCMLLIRYPDSSLLFVFLIVAVILFAIGISRLIRGLLQRKTKQEIQSLEQTNTVEAKKQDGTPAVLRS